MPQKTKKTLLHNWHTAQGAHMADFGGYHMPLWYPTGAKQEHLSVLTNAGIFDTSHMSILQVAGPGAFELLQFCFTKNLDACAGKNQSPLKPGKCVYGAFLNDNGEVVDDAIVYRLAGNRYLVVVNAGMGGRMAEHLNVHAERRKVEVTDLTDQVGKMDIQGPSTAGILMRVLDHPDKTLQDMAYFTFKGEIGKTTVFGGQVRLIDGTPLLLSRTGYTGEFGFEIFIAPEHFVKVWELIIQSGRDLGLIPCGLAARDSLRTGAVLPLSHQDIGPWPFVNHPWPFALPFNADGTGFTKRFVGAEALLNVKEPVFTYPFVGYDLRKVSICAPAVVLNPEGTKIGDVLTCVTDMGIGRHDDRIYSIASSDKPENFHPQGLSCGFVKVRLKLFPGQIVYLKDNRRKIKVIIVEDIRPDRTARRPIREMMP
jgi:aminomethyltransferase